MRICFALAAMLFVVQAASAAEPPKASDTLKPRKKNDIASPITDRFALRVTYFPSSVSTQLRLDPRNGPGLPGTDLVAENDLGMSDKDNQARMELTFRLREKNRLRVDYFKLGRSGDQVITRIINFGNQTFNVNDRVQSMLEWRQLAFTYTRSIFRFERFELGAGVGIALLEAKARGEVASRNIRESEDGVGAFPTFALDGTWRISKRWSFNARGQTLSAKVRNFNGSMSDYHADVQYRWAGNFSLGLGYTRLRTFLDVTDNNHFNGRYQQRVSGPEFFIRASF
jgi:hypothetical protein